MIGVFLGAWFSGLTLGIGITFLMCDQLMRRDRRLWSGVKDTMIARLQEQQQRIEELEAKDE